MNLPTHINHAFHHQSRTYPLVIRSSISQTRTNRQSHAKNITNAPYHCTMAWRSLSVVRQNGSVDRLTIPYHHRVPQHIRLPCFLLSCGGPLYIARCYTSNVTLLVLGTLIQLLASKHSILKYPEIKIHIHILQITTSQHICIVQV